MRTLAIDLGARRVGLALSDEGGRFATPYSVENVTSPEMALQVVRQVAEKEGAEQIVIGLPLNMDGTIGDAAKKTALWGRSLNEQSGLPIVYVDERLTSFAAEQELTSRKRAGEKITRQDRKRRLDAVAAATFLQEFLDGKLGPIEI